MVHKAWYSIEEVPYCFPRSSVKFWGNTPKKIIDFDLNWAFSDCNLSLNLAMALNGYEMMHKGWSSKEQVPYCFSRSSVKFPGHAALKIVKFDPNWAFPDCNCDVHAKGEGQRSKVKVIEVMTPLSHFRTTTPVWIHIWQWNDAQSLMLLRRGALLFFKVIRQISRSHG